MARILAYTSPARGHLYPLVPILDELARRGHQIAVRTLASQVPLLQARGFAAAPISEQIESLPHDDFQARTPQAKLKRGVAKFAERSVPPSAIVSPIASWKPSLALSRNRYGCVLYAR